MALAQPPRGQARIAAAGANAEATLASFDGVVLQALRQTETALSACTQGLNANAAWRRRVGMQSGPPGRHSNCTVTAGSISSMCFRPRPRWQMRSPHWPPRARSGSTVRWMCSCHWVAVGLEGPSPLVRPAEIVFAAAAAPICS